MNVAGTVRVEVPPDPGTSYDVIVERGGLARLGPCCVDAAPAHAYALISDSRVAGLYGRAALDSFGSTGRRAELFEFPAGEWNKSRETWAELSDDLLAAGFGRDTVVVGLGGGVTGDLAGFVAATFMRGVPVVQVPTTVLAMVDSSVGGKTGVDAHRAKNAIGAFHHPALVLVDPDLLVTLAPFQRIAGLAESVKMAVMRDDALFDWIASAAPELREGEPDTVTQLIVHSVRLKAAVVEADPTEQGERAILNFGHTAGHALETLSGFSLLHGEAVAQGMRLEARLGESLGLTVGGTVERLDSVLSACGLPLELDPDVTTRAILEAAGSDKKAREGALRWSVPARIGEAARTSSGEWTHAIDASSCEAELRAALRTAANVPDSPA
jgi:3-dehydroquinate synthase